MSKTVDFRQDGTLIVNTSHYNNVERVLVENGTNGTLFYPDDDGRNNHKVEEAISILKNAAWLGTNAKREETEKAIETLAEALNLKQSDAEKAQEAEEEKEMKDAFTNYLCIPKCERQFYRVCMINGKYGVYAISYIIDSCVKESIERLLNRLVGLDIKPSYNNLNRFLDSLAEEVNKRMEIIVKKGADDDT